MGGCGLHHIGRSFVSYSHAQGHKFFKILFYQMRLIRLRPEGRHTVKVRTGIGFFSLGQPLIVDRIAL